MQHRYHKQDWLCAQTMFMQEFCSSSLLVSPPTSTAVFRWKQRLLQRCTQVDEETISSCTLSSVTWRQTRNCVLHAVKLAYAWCCGSCSMSFWRSTEQSSQSCRSLSINGRIWLFKHFASHCKYYLKRDCDNSWNRERIVRMQCVWTFCRLHVP